MRVFSCQSCGQRTYFDNVRCERCGAPLGFVPAIRELSALRPAVAGGEVWSALGSEALGPLRRCGNWVDRDVCNWMVPAADPEWYCTACRLNELIPDLSQPGNLQLWARLESAKRRVLYGLMALGLPVLPKRVDPGGLAFRFLADPGLPGEPGSATTGHADGVITVNVAEADDAVREERRLRLHEPYRTLVGHFRHESGHYYWDRLLAGDEHLLRAFRDRFGDEGADYPSALQRHYEQGPPGDWNDAYVTAYATVHPWEDWAETWAHYLHLVDTLETATALGVTVPDPDGGPPGPTTPFDALLARWTILTVALNELNRSMGQPDLYPFVLPPPAVAKLRFVHEVVSGPAHPPPLRHAVLHVS